MEAHSGLLSDRYPPSPCKPAYAFKFIRSSHGLIFTSIATITTLSQRISPLEGVYVVRTHFSKQIFALYGAGLLLGTLYSVPPVQVRVRLQSDLQSISADGDSFISSLL